MAVKFRYGWQHSPVYIEKYIEILEKIAVMKKKYIQTDIAFLMPPKMRTKSRYLNIFEMSKWLYKTLKYCEINKAFIKEYLDELKQLGVM